MRLKNRHISRDCSADNSCWCSIFQIFHGPRAIYSWFVLMIYPTFVLMTMFLHWLLEILVSHTSIEKIFRPIVLYILNFRQKDFGQKKLGTFKQSFRTKSNLDMKFGDFHPILEKPHNKWRLNLIKFLGWSNPCKAWTVTEMLQFMTTTELRSLSAP